MPTLQLIVPGSGSAFAGTGLGKFSVLPNVRDSLYAGYLLGSSFSPNPLQDLSGNGRDLTKVGSTAFGATSLACSNTSYLETPFTGDTVFSGHSAVTAIIIAKGPSGTNQGNVFMSTGSTGKAFGLQSNGTNRNATTGDGTNTATAVISSVDSEQATAFAMFASVHTSVSAAVMHTRTGAANLIASATKASAASGGTNLARIGRGYSTSTPYANNAPTVAAALFYNQALTQDEIFGEVFPALVDLMEAYGVTL